MYLRLLYLPIDFWSFLYSFYSIWYTLILKSLISLIKTSIKFGDFLFHTLSYLFMIYPNIGHKSEWYECCLLIVKTLFFQAGDRKFKFRKSRHQKPRFLIERMGVFIVLIIFIHYLSENGLNTYHIN